MFKNWRRKHLKKVNTEKDEIMLFACGCSFVTLILIIIGIIWLINL